MTFSPHIPIVCPLDSRAFYCDGGEQQRQQQQYYRHSCSKPMMMPTVYIFLMHPPNRLSSCTRHYSKYLLRINKIPFNLLTVLVKFLFFGWNLLQKKKHTRANTRIKETRVLCLCWVCVYVCVVESWVIKCVLLMNMKCLKLILMGWWKLVIFVCKFNLIIWTGIALRGQQSVWCFSGRCVLLFLHRQQQQRTWLSIFFLYMGPKKAKRAKCHRRTCIADTRKLSAQNYAAAEL